MDENGNTVVEGGDNKISRKTLTKNIFKELLKDEPDILGRVEEYVSSNSNFDESKLQSVSNQNVSKRRQFLIDVLRTMKTIQQFQEDPIGALLQHLEDNDESVPEGSSQGGPESEPGSELGSSQNPTPNSRSTSRPPTRSQVTPRPGVRSTTLRPHRRPSSRVCARIPNSPSCRNRPPSNSRGSNTDDCRRKRSLTGVSEDLGTITLNSRVKRCATLPRGDIPTLSHVITWDVQNSLGTDIEKVTKTDGNWKAGDFRAKKVSDLASTSPGENVDHSVELQLVAQAADNANIESGSVEALIIKKVFNSKVNLVAMNERLNRIKGKAFKDGKPTNLHILEVTLGIQDLRENGEVKNLIEGNSKIAEFFQKLDEEVKSLTPHSV